MKKNLLMGMVGLGAMALCITGVKAETLDLTNVSETGQSVTVGEVDVPVYSVDITWGDLTYDYKYNDETGNYYWQAKEDSDELETVPGTIQIYDNSTNGRIEPSISWSSEEKYDYVKGNFQYEGPIASSCLQVESQDDLDNYNYIYTDSECKMPITENNPIFVEGKYYYGAYGTAGWKDLTTTVIPDEGRIAGANSWWYNIKISLVNDTTKEVKYPNTGDKIGTVTISIDAK